MHNQTQVPNVFKVKRGGYTQISNAPAQNTRLSLKAKGLYYEIATLPPDWHFSISGMTELATDGRDSTRSSVKELEFEGFLIRAQARNNKGRFSDNTVWFLLGDPELIPTVIEIANAHGLYIVSDLEAIKQHLVSLHQDLNAPQITVQYPSNCPINSQNEKPQVTTDGGFSDIGPDLGIVENFPQDENTPDSQNEKPQVTTDGGFSDIGESNTIKGYITPSNSTINRNLPLVVTNNQPTNQEERLTYLKEGNETQTEVSVARRMDGDLIFGQNEKIPTGLESSYNSLIRQTVNRNRLKDTRLPYSKLLLEGFTPEEIEAAWLAKQNDCATRGIEKRYYPQLYRWLCGDGVYTDIKAIRATKSKKPNLTSLVVKYWQDPIVSELYDELTSHPEERKTNEGLIKRIRSRISSLDATFQPA